MPEQINFKIDVPGRDVSRLGPRSPSMKSIVAAIHAYGLHPRLESEVIRRASSYPTVALPRFLADITRHIAEAQNTVSVKD